MNLRAVQGRALGLPGLSLWTSTYEGLRLGADAHLTAHITELEIERRRFGKRRYGNY